MSADLRALLPAFLPDATRAGVRGVGSEDLRAAGVQALMVNIFHLLRRPGIRVIQHVGGIHRFMDWDGPVMSDSGGFQVYSLIRQNPDYGTIRPNEVIFRDPETSQKWQFSPERSVQMQFQIGSDAVVCLDDCTDATSSPAELEASVDRTIRWAARCKAEFERLTAAVARAETPSTAAGGCPGRRQPGASRPLRARAGGDRLRWLRLRRLADHTRRRPARRSAGGCRQLRPHTIRFATRSASGDRITSSRPRSSASTRSIAVCRPATPDAVDSTSTDPNFPAALGESVFYDNLHILDERYRAERGPVDPSCDCACCARFSRAYLQHLLKVGDASGERLASIHNLRFYTRLVDQLRTLTSNSSASS